MGVSLYIRHSLKIKKGKELEFRSILAKSFEKHGSRYNYLTLPNGKPVLFTLSLELKKNTVILNYENGFRRECIEYLGLFIITVKDVLEGYILCFSEKHNLDRDAEYLFKLGTGKVTVDVVSSHLSLTEIDKEEYESNKDKGSEFKKNYDIYEGDTGPRIVQKVLESYSVAKHRGRRIVYCKHSDNNKTIYEKQDFDILDNGEFTSEKELHDMLKPKIEVTDKTSDIIGSIMGNAIAFLIIAGIIAAIVAFIVLYESLMP